MPANAHGGRVGAGDDEWLLAFAAVVCEVLGSEQRGLGPAGVAPLSDQLRVVSGASDVAEEVVGGEEHETAAEVAISLHEVVEALGDVLGVAREDDQVVCEAEHLGDGNRSMSSSA